VIADTPTTRAAAATRLDALLKAMSSAAAARRVLRDLRPGGGAGRPGGRRRRTATIRSAARSTVARGGRSSSRGGRRSPTAVLAWARWGGTRRDTGCHRRIGGLDGIDIVVITNNAQATDSCAAHVAGRRPDAQAHARGQVDAPFPRRFRADRARVLLIDSGSLCTEDYKAEMYKRAAARSGRSNAVTP